MGREIALMLSNGPGPLKRCGVSNFPRFVTDTRSEFSPVPSLMPLSDTQKKDVLEVLEAVYSYSVGRRVLSTIFRELPDKNEWKEYYAVIPQPRCLDGVKVSWAADSILGVHTLI